ncbi:MAG: potassium transporter TrkG [Marinirhabdus sp.]|nr:potassium transporter TrkG [Marinirhabdus sp.]
MKLLLKKFNDKYVALKRSWSPQQNLFYGFLTYIIAGTVLLSMPWLQKQSVPLLDNLFIATSAVSTTGLVTVSIFDSYTTIGQLVILVLFQLGGIGYLTFTTFMLLSTTRKITPWHKSILSSEFTLPVTIRISDFLKSVIRYTVLMEVIGTVLFFIAFRANGMTTADALWNSIFHSISAFCTAGFSLFNSGFTEYVDNGLINFTISMLAICGSLGFIVITDIGLWIKKRKHQLSFTTKIVTVGSVLLLLFGYIFFYFLEPTVSTLSGSARISAAFFQSMTAMTTVGFNTVDFGMFILPMLLVTTFLMYIGASPSGTAGGMKITTLTAVFAIMKSRIRGDKNITFLGRRIPYERLYIATSSFIFYTSIIAFGSFILSFSESFNFENILFEVASALGTVGLSTGITAGLSVIGKITIIVLMFIGRLGVLTFGLAIWSKHISDKERQVLKEDLAV